MSRREVGWGCGRPDSLSFLKVDSLRSSHQIVAASGRHVDAEKRRLFWTIELSGRCRGVAEVCGRLRPLGIRPATVSRSETNCSTCFADS